MSCFPLRSGDEAWVPTPLQYLCQFEFGALSDGNGTQRAFAETASLCITDAGSARPGRVNPSLSMLVRFWPTLILLSAAPLFVHAQAQSALQPLGENATRIAEITWVLFAGGTIIFLAVMALAGIALFGSSGLRMRLGKKALVIGGGLVFPIVTLSLLLVYVFTAQAFAIRGDIRPAARIEVTGELWWWRVKYLNRDGAMLFETANEIRIPAGRDVELLLQSNEVIHSFWVPNLAGKLDLIPGHVNRLLLQANAPGIYRGQCAEYCGAQHAKMAFYVVAQRPEEYEDWLRRQQQAAGAPADPQSVLGKRLFLESRCGICHTIRGTEADGALGPDLTHLGSRVSLAAGILPNNTGTIAGWIADSQEIKPGSRMPAFKRFSGEELRALSAYLASLG